MTFFRTRRLLIRQLALVTASASLPWRQCAAALADAGNEPMSDAIAVWQMADLSDSAGLDSRIEARGNARVGVELGKAERAASRARGGDGFAAELSGGWFTAGRGAGDELVLSGGALTAVIRFRAAHAEWGFPLFSQYVSPTTGVDPARRGIFNLLSTDFGAGPVLAAQLGSDEVSGFHLVQTSVRGLSPRDWHDVVLRFDGRTLQLFLDGALCDEEIAVGVLSSRHRPCLIGADAHAEARNGRRVFHGLIDHAALWKRALTDREIATLSGARRVSDRRPRYYHEKYRPQFHFSARKHWLNDPNGLVFYDGVYHLFFQHMPPGRPYAYKDWGHAVSTDLVHWRQLDSALTPHRELGGCWSGSVVVDVENTSGFQAGAEKPVVAILTNGGGWNREPFGAPRNTQCLAFSTDGGRTFQYYENNPVIGHIKGYNRDPKVLWHAPTGRWVMVLYIEDNDYSLFSSPDLKSWTRLSDITLPGTIECPDLFELPVDADATIRRWVFWSGGGTYLIGVFDGTTFHPQSPPLRGDYGADFYAAQTWSHIPASDGRTLQIAWMREGEYPQMPFSQQMSFPTELSLRTTPEGLRLHRVPAREIAKLHRQERRWSNHTVSAHDNPFAGLAGDSWHILLDMEPGSATAFGVKIRGYDVRYDVAARRLSAVGCDAPVAPSHGRIRLEILVDRTSIEVFANDGAVVLSSCFLPPDADTSLALNVEGGSARIDAATVWSLASIWT